MPKSPASPPPAASSTDLFDLFADTPPEPAVATPAAVEQEPEIEQAEADPALEESSVQEDTISDLDEDVSAVDEEAESEFESVEEEIVEELLLEAIRQEEIVVIADDAPIIETIVEAEAIRTLIEEQRAATEALQAATAELWEAVSVLQQATDAARKFTEAMNSSVTVAAETPEKPASSARSKTKKASEPSAE